MESELGLCVEIIAKLYVIIARVRHGVIARVIRGYIAKLYLIIAGVLHGVIARVMRGDHS